MESINIYEYLKYITDFLNKIGEWAYEHLYIVLPVLVFTILTLILVKLFT